MTTQFSEKSPRELWDEMRQTKYADDEIRHRIDTAWSHTAQAMIAYNEMIDARIERAQRTWGMK